MVTAPTPDDPNMGALDRADHLRDWTPGSRADDDDLAEVLPCICGQYLGHDGSHLRNCPAQHRPVLRAWHDAQVAAACDQARQDGAEKALLTLAAERDLMAQAWGGRASWVTTGDHVADLVSEWVTETAAEYAEGERS